MSAATQLGDLLGLSAARAIDKSSRAVRSMRHREGYWWADLTADSTLESDYILLQLWLYPPVNGTWEPETRDRVDKAAKAILDRQLPDGGFNIYPHGPSEISASVKAYFALKLAGIGVDDPRMARARLRILELGGLQAANSYVKVNLSLFNLYPREHCPAIPPEPVLFGNLLYKVSAWTRAIIVPLSIIHSANPSRPVPAGFHLDEIVKPGASFEFPNDQGFFSWRNFFLTLDRGFKLWEKYGSRRIRAKAVERSKAWMIEHTRHSDGLGAIYPPMMYTIMALDVLGYPPSHPEMVEARRQFDALLVDDGDRFFFQPCFSPVWDTAIAAFALGEAGCESSTLTRSADWLLSKECRRKGDWAVNRPELEPSGWAFEFNNEFYPDIDDTGMVLLALKHARGSDRDMHRDTVKRACDWLLGMQCKDGGWAAFDVDNDWKFLEQVPFADHNAMLDPSCADITGRVIEALCEHGFDPAHPAIRRGVEYLAKAQEADGSWYGRWGVGYLYGTFLAARGLRAAGESPREAHLLRAGEWIRSIQNPDGGWGESCESYDRGTFVAGPSTASQTAWAILGLIASGDDDSMSLTEGIGWLVRNQREDGRWDEDRATGTGFPRVFYLTYHLYRDVFPLLALSTYMRYRNQTRGDLA